ncbi:MAG: thrombospondin type 3 repeat-containing protein [Thermoleophilaceae bacterium]
MRYAVIAILAALAALAAGAQASSGDSGSSSGEIGHVGTASVNPLTKSPFRFGSGTRHHVRRLLRTPGPTGSDNYTTPPNLSGDINSNAACRFSNECFAVDENNNGATIQSSPTPEPNMCTFSSTTVTFKATVWYAFQVNHDGVLDMDIDGTYTPGFTPVLLVAPYDGSTATPDFANAFCLVADPSQTIALRNLGIGAGTIVSVAVAAVNSGNTGEYDIGFSWDPDTDGDGVLDSSDRCPSARGPSSLRGCPDSDGDGIANVDDRCPTLRGPKSLAGCPDTDGDGLIDPKDACPRESTRGQIDRNANGCPDFKAIPDLSASSSPKIKGNKIIGETIALKFKGKLPKGTKVKIKCKPKKNCKLRRHGSVRKRIKLVKFRTRRTKITVKVTKKGYVSKVFTIKAGYNPAHGGGRIVLAAKVKKRCIPVGGHKSRKCTAAMLLR